jgi:hypothetical protein
MASCRHRAGHDRIEKGAQRAPFSHIGQFSLLGAHLDEGHCEETIYVIVTDGS